MNDDDPLLRQALRAVSQSFGKLYLAAAWPYLLVPVIVIAFRLILLRYVGRPQTVEPAELWRSMSVGAKLGVLVTFIATSWLPAGLAYASVARSVLQSELSLGEVILSILRRFVPLAVLSVMLGIAITAGHIFFFFPGVFIETFCAFAVPVMVMEKRGVFASIGRSFSLTSRRFWEVLGVLIAAIVVAVLVYLAASAFLIPLIQPGSGPVNVPVFVIFLVLMLLIVPPLAMAVFGTSFVVLYSNLTKGEQAPVSGIAKT